MSRDTEKLHLGKKKQSFLVHVVSVLYIEGKPNVYTHTHLGFIFYSVHISGSF